VLYLELHICISAQLQQWELGINLMQPQPLQVEPGGQQSCTLETIVRTEECDLQTISCMQDSLTEASVMDGNRALRAKEVL
jgi:hypothetical protein